MGFVKNAGGEATGVVRQVAAKLAEASEAARRAAEEMAGASAVAKMAVRMAASAGVDVVVVRAAAVVVD
eukprot:1477012-Prymnesium_polylepis.1